jgi:alpha-L-fucosidase 2
LPTAGKTNLTSAGGENHNPFYQTPDIKQPLVSNPAGLKNVDLKNTFVYDIETQAGKTYVFSKL